MPPRPPAALILPAVVYIATVVGGALLLAVHLSLTDSIAGSLSGPFVGGENFRRALGDPLVRRALLNTLFISVTSQVIAVALGTVLATFFAREFRGKQVLLVLVLLPWAAPVALGAISWKWILDSLFSVLNWTLRAVPVIGPDAGPQWLGDQALAMTSVIGVNVWRSLPFAMVVVLAGLSAISAEIDDAATVDGAVGWRRMLHVTIPLLSPVIAITLLFGVVLTANGMAVVYVLTEGGPLNSTQVASTWAFETGIVSGALGPGAAISLTLLPLLAVTSVMILRFTGKVDLGT